MRIFQATILAIAQVHSFQPQKSVYLRGGAGAAHTRDLQGYSSTLKYEEHQQELDLLVDGTEIGESFEETRENSEEVAGVEWVQEEDLASDLLDNVVEEVPDDESNNLAMSMTSPRLFHVAQDTPADFEDEKQSSVADTAGVGDEEEGEEDEPSFEPEPTEPDEEIPPPLTVEEIEKIDVDATDNTASSTANNDVMTTDEEILEDTYNTVIQEKSISSATDTLAMRAKSIGTSFFEMEDETPASVTVTITSPNVGSAVFEYDGKDSSSSTTTEGVMSEASSVFEFEDEATIEAASDVKFGGFEFEEDEEDMEMMDQDTLEMTEDENVVMGAKGSP